MYAPRARSHRASHLGLLATFFNTLLGGGIWRDCGKKAIDKQVPTRAFRLRPLADGATEPLASHSMVLGTDCSPDAKARRWELAVLARC